MAEADIESANFSLKQFPFQREIYISLKSVKKTC